MPWELGFKDGQNSRVAVFPIAKTISVSNEYKGVEYLGIYPYVTDGQLDNSAKKTLWVHRDSNNYVPLVDWAKGRKQLS
jgi:hypothetical protein